MTVDEARDECRRWLAHCDNQRERSVLMQTLAADRRAGRCNDAEVSTRLASIDSTRVVYDGAELERAVRVLLEASE